MAEGWKQVWEDIRNALRSAQPEEAPVATPPETVAGGTAAVAVPPVPSDDAPIAIESTPAAIAAPDAASIDTAPEPTSEDSPAATSPIVLSASDAKADAPALIDPYAEAVPGDLNAIGERAAGADEGAVPDAEADAPVLINPYVEAASSDLDAISEPAIDTDTTPAQVPFWRRHAWTILTILAVAAAVSLFYRFDGTRLWAQWMAPKPPAPDVVATFDGGKITTADLEAHAQALAPDEYREVLRSPETLRLLAQEMATDELARRWASERKVDADETFQHTMEHITENTNLDAFSTKLHEGGIPVPESEIQSYYDKNKAEFGDQPLSAVREEIRTRLVGEKEGQYLKDYIAGLTSNASITRDFTLLDVPEPTDAELRAYYEANTQSYTVTAQFTVDMLTIPAGADETAARAAADKALLKLRAGEAFGAIPAQVAEARIITGTVVPAGRFGAQWDAAVQALQPGEVSDIIRASEMFAIVRLIQAQPERRLTFEEARPQMLETLSQERINTWMKENGSKTLFVLKGKQYTLGQFYKEYQELPPSTQARFAGPKGMRDLADRLIERLLVVEDTYDQLLQVKNKELIDENRLSVLKQMMEQQEVDDKIEVTDAEIQQYYDQNQALMTPPPKVKLRYIRIGLGQTEDEKTKARARADEAYKKLVPGLFQQGASFADIAKEYSEDPETAAKGGELPFAVGETNNPLEPPELHQIHTIVLGLDVNQISPLFEVGDSLYIIQPIERTQPETLSLDKAKPYIKELLTNQKHDDLLRSLQDRLAKQANLVIYDSAIQAYYERSSGTAVPTSSP